MSWAINSKSLTCIPGQLLLLFILVGCYGVAETEITSSWRCDQCTNRHSRAVCLTSHHFLYLVHVSANATVPVVLGWNFNWCVCHNSKWLMTTLWSCVFQGCCLCMMRGGAMKRTTSGHYAHISCALVMPDCYFESVSLRQDINCSDIDGSRHRLVSEDPVRNMFTHYSSREQLWHIVLLQSNSQIFYERQTKDGVFESTCTHQSIQCVSATRWYCDVVASLTASSMPASVSGSGSLTSSSNG